MTLVRLMAHFAFAYALAFVAVPLCLLGLSFALIELVGGLGTWAVARASTLLKRAVDRSERWSLRGTRPIDPEA